MGSRPNLAELITILRLLTKIANNRIFKPQKLQVLNMEYLVALVVVSTNRNANQSHQGCVYSQKFHKFVTIGQVISEQESVHKFQDEEGNYTYGYGNNGPDNGLISFVAIKSLQNHFVSGLCQLHCEVRVGQTSNVCIRNPQ